MEIRAFRSDDAPLVVDLWNRRVNGCYATGPLTVAQWVADVRDKCYFDPDGLLLGFEGGRPCAFVHAGFKSSDAIQPDPRLGTIGMVAVEEGRLVVGAACLAAAVRYLFRKGARQIEAFTIDFANTPFYNGLYGGEKAGMDEAHPLGVELMARGGFKISSGTLIMLHDLSMPEPAAADVPGLQLQVTPWLAPWKDLPPERCYGIPELIRRAALRKADGTEVAGISFWHLDRYNRSTGDRLAVVTHVWVASELRGGGAAVWLQREVHRVLRQEGATRVGLGVTGTNGRAVAFYMKMGYRPFQPACFFHLDWRRYGEAGE